MVLFPSCLGFEIDKGLIPDRVQAMPETRRDEVREKIKQHLQNLPAEQRTKLKEYFSSLSMEERRVLRKKLKGMTPEQRRQYLKQLIKINQR